MVRLWQGRLKALAQGLAFVRSPALHCESDRAAWHIQCAMYA